MEIELREAPLKIETMEAREILDSRGRPTVEVVFTAEGHTVTASVPSGKSTGSKEALEKRDADGRGVQDVLTLLRDEVFPKMQAQNFDSPRALDKFLITLDGTPNKSRLGANGILAVSIAFTKLSAAVSGLPLWRYIAECEGFTPAYPRLYMNVLNGGAHADFCLPFQEYILVIGGTPTRAYPRAQKLFTTLGERMRKEVGEVSLGDEGGYAPRFATLERPFEILTELIAGEDEIFLAIDAAATEFSDNDKYTLLDKSYTSDEFLSVYAGLMREFPLRSIEDAFAEDDVASFAKLLASAPQGTLVVGDDLTVTNAHVLREMIAARAGNALIVKPNQIGTLSEVYDTVRMAHEAGWKTIVSHRSGETLDPFIADLAVGVGAYGLKAGAPSQQARAVKYERLVVIEKEFPVVQ
ncbi:MAG: hypothetical protein AAB552_03550 [Patescibacteria group bacterium]